MAPRMHNSFAILALCGLVEEVVEFSSFADEPAISFIAPTKKPKKGKRTRKARKPSPVLPPVAPIARSCSTAQASAGPSCIAIDDIVKFIAMVLALVLVINLLVPPGVRPPPPKPVGAAKHPVVIIPGYITSHLEVWQGHACAAQRSGRAHVWGTLGMLKMMMFKPSCWLHHMALDRNGLDPTGVKVRAVQGIQGAQDLVPFYTIWGRVVAALASVGYDTANLAVLPFDWRLATAQMEARDAWFSTTRSTIEQMVQRTGHKAVLMSHSYGENVARTLLHWAEAQQPGWVEQYVQAHAAVAGPSLGLPVAVPILLSGEMGDTAQMPPLVKAILDAWLPPSHRTRTLRSWKSLVGLLPVGGPKVWGNASWAPDDEPAIHKAGRSYGAMVTSTTDSEAAFGLYEVEAMHVGQAIGAALTAAGHSVHRDDTLLASPTRVNHGNATVTTSKSQLPVLPNALTTPLPNAPSLKLFYLYGVGVPTERAYHYEASYLPVANPTKINTQAADPSTGLVNGIQMADGDVTVPLLSLGGLSRGGWRSKRLNPAGIQVVTKEYQHRPVSPLRDIGGGPASASHKEILTNHELLSDLVAIATGAADTVQDRIVSDIDRVVSRIPWEDVSGWV